MAEMAVVVAALPYESLMLPTGSYESEINAIENCTSAMGTKKIDVMKECRKPNRMREDHHREQEKEFARAA